MADLLTLDQARTALGWAPGTHSDQDADLKAIWIPMVTEAIESPKVCGRMSERRESFRTVRSSPITTPWATGAVVFEVWRNGATVNSDYWSFSDPTLTITDPSYEDGDEITAWAYNLPTPSSVTAAAQATLKSAWNQLNQGSGSGSRPQPDAGMEGDPSALIPPLAWRLLSPYRTVGGFA